MTTEQITQAEIENLEANIAWAYNNAYAISQYGYTIDEYIAYDKTRLEELLTSK